ncbi:MAG: hypothetical protein DCF25_10435 [Leptolyngbya foveolarum]|uniref:Uncharacterized protein n=1 Tax=Leptolyngbya foveolarum TaxID=47253 RepID=A0A2W4UBB7_9CYAN|nr:MAG: hypothetical protein DCF25_10435 [Leptolyngbya foveolarum]
MCGKEPSVHCPKESDEDLSPAELTKDLAVYRCGHCAGNWLPSAHYQRWQALNAGLNAVRGAVVRPRRMGDFRSVGAACPNSGGVRSGLAGANSRVRKSRAAANGGRRETGA